MTDPPAPLFDTNILIDALRGCVDAQTVLDRTPQSAISHVTWIRVRAGTPPGLDAASQVFLDGFVLVRLSDDIAARAATLRRERRLKLPDAVILASAISTGRRLLTRDRRLAAVAGPERAEVPYEL